jgi:hypothetical protein
MKQEELNNWIKRVEQKIAGAQRRTRAISSKDNHAPEAPVETPQGIPQSSEPARETA